MSVSSGKTLFGATVVLEPGTVVSMTAADGSYAFSVAPGTYMLTASASGYGSASHTVSVASDQIQIVNLTLDSPLSVSIGIAGTGLLRLISDVLKVAIGVILDVLQSGASTLWNGILGSMDIFKAAQTAEQLRNPAYWSAFWNDVYFKVGRPQAKARIDDCVLGEFGVTWADLTDEQKLNEDLQFCILNSKGYPSGTIAPEFMRQWLE